MRYLTDPGPWLQYRKKPGNEKLSLHEATQKYKHEQMFYDLQNQAPMHAAHAGKSLPAFGPGEGGRVNLRNAASLWERDRQRALTHYGEINTWDVSRVTSMGEVFLGLTTFNSDISNWNTSGVTNMTAMFYGAAAFNQDISSWNVENVTSMTSMFQAATSFVQDISAWNPFSLTVASSFMDLDDTVANTADYDALLVAWGAHAAAGEIPAAIGSVNFGDVKFTKATSDAATGRGQLVTRGFTPDDGGPTS
tara:strand:- start:138 stop:887 length:750 start_codon:yes stop_codon:yes gene_type:complete